MKKPVQLVHYLKYSNYPLNKMSDAPAAQLTENSVPLMQVIKKIPSFKVFTGNFTYSTMDEGLRAFFAPVQNDIITVQVIM
jgi:hypothetical protein